MGEVCSAAPTAYCGTMGSMRFAGIHLLIELWDAEYMTDAEVIGETIKEAIEACGATLLSLDLHEFSPNAGISGVAVLQESHISIHTWPEFGYAAMDIFVCGTVDPYKALPVFQRVFQPGKMQVVEVKRGIF